MASKGSPKSVQGSPKRTQGELQRHPRELQRGPGGAQEVSRGLQMVPQGAPGSLKGYQGYEKTTRKSKFYILGFILKELYSKFGFQDLNFKFYIPSSIFEGCYTPRFLFQVYIPSFIKTIREGIRRLDSKIYISSVIFQVLYSRDVSPEDQTNTRHTRHT